MEDDKLKSLFTNFEPELSSDFKFMNKLERNLNSVEIIKRHTAEVRSRNKKAVAIAAFAGFIVGFVFSLFLPYLSNAVSDWQSTLPGGYIIIAKTKSAILKNEKYIFWCFPAISGASV